MIRYFLLFVLILLASVSCKKKDNYIKFKKVSWNSDFMLFETDSLKNYQEAQRASIVLGVYGFDYHFSGGNIYINKDQWNLKDSDYMWSISNKINDTAWLKNKFNHIYTAKSLRH